MRTTIVACSLLLASAALAGGGEPGAATAVWPDHPVNDWVRQSPRQGGPPAPKLVYEGGGDYDPFTRLWIHHGGHEGIGQTERTFVYDLRTRKWRQRFPDTSPPGACCLNNNGVVFDVANRRLVRFPAGSLGHGWQFSRSVYLKNAPASVWTYDTVANTWTAMRPPPYKAPKAYTTPWVIGGTCSVSAYDPVHEVMIHMPNNHRYVAEVYVYDAYDNSLKRFVAETKPSGRAAHGMAYDPRNRRVVVFGSGTGNDEKTWLLDLKTNTWQALSLQPHPPGKKEGQYSTHPVMAYDSRNRVMLCVIWHPKGGGHETWILDTAPKPTWRKMDPPTSPINGSSRTRNLGYSAEHNVFILEMVQAKSKTPNEIWTYRYRQAPADKRPAPPAGLTCVTDKGKATVTWSASPTAGVKEYRVYRAETDQAWRAEYKLLAKTAKTSFADTGLAAGKVHFYKVSAVGADGAESDRSRSVRTQPRVLLKPVVSVLAKDKVEVRWNAHPAKDVAGYNLYRGVVTVKTVKKGTRAPWRPNDPEYPQPRVNGVADITGIRRLNDAPLTGTRFTDTQLDLTKKGPESGDYRYAVYAYIVRAINRLGAESGPSPYALTIPSEPTNVLLRNKAARAWELKWDASPEKGIAGYRVYSMVSTHEPRPLVPLAEPPLPRTRLTGQGGQSLWVTAVDALGQEGQPSSPAKTSRRYRQWYKAGWHQ